MRNYTREEEPWTFFVRPRLLIGSLILLLGVLSLNTTAQTVSDFELFNTGSVNYQGTGATIITPGGYTVPSPYGSLWTVSDEWGFGAANPLDQAVTDDGTGNMVWRISNAVTQGGFSNLPYSPISPLPAGETAANLWNDRGDNHTAPLNPPNPRATADTPHFHCQLRFKSATGAPQNGLSVSLSAGAKQGSIRQSFISISDNGSAGLDIGFFDTNASGVFVNSILATDLSYTEWHELDIYITFNDGVNIDGSGNDVVSVLLDGNLVHTGTTWESYYESLPLSFPLRPYAVDALMFRVSGTAQPSLSGGGLFFDDVVIDNAPLVVVTPGCMAVSACNYDSSADLDDGSCTYDCYGCTVTDPSAQLDDNSCALCDETEDFNGAITLAAEQTPDAWYVDRWAPAGFISNASFGGGQRLRQIISEFDGAIYRGAQSSAFYNTQGRKLDLPENTKSLEIELYVPADWATTNRRMAGLWGTGVNAADDIAAYPIIEFASDNDTPRFQVWTAAGWTSIGLPTGFAYNNWYTLQINLLESGEFLYRVGDLAFVTNNYASAATARIDNVILQGHNTETGVDYVIHWDNLSYGSTCAGFNSLSYEVVQVNGVQGYTTYRVYADFDYETDELIAVYGVNSISEQSPLSITTTGVFYQDPNGGLSALNVNPAAYGFFPSLEFDSYLALGALPQSTSLLVTGIAPSDFSTTGITINDQDGGLWYITPGSEPEAVAGADGKVLIGQFTTNGVVSMTVNLQYNGANGVTFLATQESITFGTPTEGCTDNSACNYNTLALVDDGSCVFPGCTDSDACNYALAAGCDDGSCSYACITAFYVNDDILTSDVYTSAIGNDSNNGTSAAPFATITKALQLATAGDTIYVDAGSYAEEFVIDKSVVLLGANATISPNGGTRVVESILYPASTGLFVYQVDVVADDVTIKGFTFDGDNPALTTGYTNTTGADIDAASAIEAYEGGVDRLIVENNIIQNYFYFAVTIYPYYNGAGTPSSGHIVSNNLIRDLGTYDDTYTYAYWGGAVLVYNNAYAAIENNVFDNVRMGVQTGNFYQPTPDADFSHGIRNNTISTRRTGVFHNLAYSNASAYPVENNEIVAIDNAIESRWRGILLSSLSVPASIAGNTVDGSAASALSEGINVWNVKNTHPVSISGGSISGVDHGIFLNNFEGYNSNGNDGAHATISDVTISADINGIWLLDSPSYTGTADAAVVATVSNSFITGSVNAITLEETRANKVSASVNNNHLTHTSGLAIAAASIANTVDATCNWFGTAVPSEVATDLSGDVTFVPLLINGNDDDAAEGFQPEAAACQTIVEGCTNPSACNYDETANLNNGTCDFDCIVCNGTTPEGTNATFAVNACNDCSTIETFTTAIVTGPTAAPGVWYTDRYAPAVFNGAVSFLGNNRLRHIISEFDGGQYRPGGQQGAFYDTQGRKLDMPAATNAVSIELYVPASWETSGRRMAGLWGTAYNASNAISGYPIIEFTSIDGVARFRGWEGNGTWVDLGLPSGFSYNQWVTLEISLLDNGQFLYRVGDLAYATTTMSAASTSIGNVILQGHNTFDGVTYTIHWDNFEYEHGLQGCTDITACNYNPAATCDDNSCIDAVATTQFDVQGAAPTIFSGFDDAADHMVIASDCNVSAAITTLERFEGNLDPLGTNVYRILSGNSPTSAGDPTPAPGLARWNYYIQLDLGDYTFNDLDVFLDIDWDPTAGTSLYSADYAQTLRDAGLGALSAYEDAQNLGFSFWSAIGDPAILPFDPFANGEYNLTLRIETLDGEPLVSAPMVVEVYTPGCTNNIACNYNANASEDDGSCVLGTLWYADADGDGFGDSNVSQTSCAQPVGYVADNTDCDDTDAAINPNTVWYADLDGDGFGDANVSQAACVQPIGYVLNNTDCDDTDAAINPNTIWYADADGDGYGNAAATLVQCAQPAGYVAIAGDCDDSNADVNPSVAESPCNGIDDNCNGDIDENQVLGCMDNAACNYNAGANCPDNASCTYSSTWYADADGDGFGNAADSIEACSAPAGYVVDNTDCDDSNEDVYPGAPGTGEDIDNNCDGVVTGDELEPCAGDFNQDGLRNSTDLLMLLANWGGSGIGDMNNDGVVNSADQLAFLGVFATACP